MHIFLNNITKNISRATCNDLSALIDIVFHNLRCSCQFDGQVQHTHSLRDHCHLDFISHGDCRTIGCNEAFITCFSSLHFKCVSIDAINGKINGMSTLPDPGFLSFSISSYLLIWKPSKLEHPSLKGLAK